MKTINIITPDNGVGLSQDRSIIKELLERNGYACEYSTATTPQNKKQYDANIFLEVLFPDYIKNARKNIIIPNPEWFFQEWKKYLPKFNSVFAKTKHTFNLFSSSLGMKSVQYTSFTSQDRYDSTIERTNTFAQFAGKSLHKGTNELIQATNIAQLPIVTIYSHNPNKRFINYSKVNRNKVVICTDRLRDEQLQSIFNATRFHICTSHYEGFGHYINEARSVGAIIITTNASPMNELVTPDFGFGVSSKQLSTRHGLVFMNQPNAKGIADAILTASKMSQQEITDCSAASREAYLTGKAQFENLFMESILRTI